MQRFFDIFFSGAALLFFSPVFLPIIFILKITGEGEIFFSQTRIGEGRKPFKLIKFATMLKNSPNMGTGTVTVLDDPRVLPVGKFLRKTKINELPQLINIFIGDMSIIGPRPQTKRCFDAFPETAQKSIIKVKPGLSGIGSIVFRNEEEMINSAKNPDKFYDEVIMPYKGALEVWYVDHKSLLNYFILIFQTIKAVVLPSKVSIFKIFPSLPKVPRQLKGHVLGVINE